MNYKLSLGLRKALWSVFYLAATAAIDAAIQAAQKTPEVTRLVYWPIILALMTLAGNWLKVRRAIPPDGPPVVHG